MADTKQLWDRYQSQLIVDERLGFALDVSRMDLDDALLAQHAALTKKAVDDMAKLEAGALANPDEKRMVGHYWLRAPQLAPTPELRAQIEDTLGAVHRFAADVHCGRLSAEDGGRFANVLVIGIGGSALGPQLVADALGGADDRMRVFFFDNTDPDGVDRVIEQIERAGGMARTLTVVISKSGGTKETRNGMLEAQAAYLARGLSPSLHLVAVTGEGSELDKTAVSQQWLARFPMWDWVGGRTSELCAVGLLPAALQGLNIEGMLKGARSMDALTRNPDVKQNPALMMALCWLKATEGKGKKDLVVLPYKDRLVLFSRYLQQLVMESLGKQHDLDGKVVHQGIAVYGNKGSTDQHAYVQQLRDGVANFFVTFLEVQKERAGSSIEVEPGVTSGDYLFGFLQGTRRALYEGGRGSITLTIDDVTPHRLGALIALWERAVGFYATLVNVNAYHQPGVEAGKKAAQAVITLQGKVVEALTSAKAAVTADQLAATIGESAETETVFKILEHLAANGRARKSKGASPCQARFTR
ncbi:MAG: glucose-6-phosphate isomerase [Deltaproteobacteria bacterium]|nr:glucose-6-phosphate isomerase [Deltaproteobacteria bacterium]